MGLSDRDREILAFEESWWANPGSKADAIRDRLGISPTQYYRHLSSLVESAEAMRARAAARPPAPASPGAAPA